MKKITLLLLLTVFCVSIGNAQQENKNVVKIGLLGLAGKNIRLSYERLLTPRISVQMSAAFLLSRGLPSSMQDKLNDKDTSGTASSSIDYVFLKGFNLMPEMRIYSKKHGAGKGFYFGPYLKYNRYSLEFGGVIDWDSYEAVGTFSSYGVGINIGTQWTIGKYISIDWNFLSLGVNFAKLSAEYSTNDPFVDYDDWADEFNSSNDNKVPLFGEFTAYGKSNGMRAETSSAPTIGIASRLAICVRF